MKGLTAAQRTAEAAARIQLSESTCGEQLLQCRQQLPASLFGLHCPLQHHSCCPRRSSRLGITRSEHRR